VGGGTASMSGRGEWKSGVRISGVW
jgi:hypothetical protein